MVPDSLPDAAVEAVESRLAEWRANEEVPGVSVAVTDAEGLLYAGGAGVRDRETEAPATPETLYAVASITKPVTAMAVLQLVERGALALEDPVDAYVDVLADAPGDPITVRELLAHASGMPRDFVAQRHLVDDGRDLDLFEHVAGAADQRLTDRPRFMYYNGGYFVLGDLVATVDGRPYEAYVREEVLAPLGAERATFDPDALDAGDAMTGYEREDGDLVAGTYDGGAGAAGGLIASVRDLARLQRCVLNGGELDGGRVLESDLVDAACSFQSPLLPTTDGSRRGYGYGWSLSEFLGEPLVAHRGGIGVSGGYVGLLRERGLGVALAYNTHAPGATLGKCLLAVAAGEDPADAVPMLRIREAVDAVTGTYEAYRGAMTATVASGPGGTIRVTVEEQGLDLLLRPEAVGDDESVFVTELGDGLVVPVEFRETDAGTRMVLSLEKWTTVFHRA